MPSITQELDWNDLGEERGSVIQVGLLDTAKIRTDGGTQCRVDLSTDTISEYRELMIAGVEFPPLRVWFDGENYWLADGFQRLAAAQTAKIRQILVEVRKGALSDAQWDSYGSNSTHGLRRNKADLINAVRSALSHAKSENLSHRELSRHLGIPESSFRRLYKMLSAPCGADTGKRLVVRKGKTFQMDTDLIGKRRTDSHAVFDKPRSLKELEAALGNLKGGASSDVAGLLNIIENWIFGPVTTKDCVAALERLRNRWRGFGQPRPAPSTHDNQYSS